LTKAVPPRKMPAGTLTGPPVRLVIYMRVCARAHARVRALACVRLRVCARAHVRACARVRLGLCMHRKGERMPSAQRTSAR
jgi:hypothetical protein